MLRARSAGFTLAGRSLLISRVRNAGASQLHPPRGRQSVPDGSNPAASPHASAPCTMRHPPGLCRAVFKSAAPSNNRSTTAGLF